MFDPAKLNSEQLFAATLTGCDILLAAGPGSGKTHTMTSRIMYLTSECGIDPSKILVITYTKDAAIGMQKRFIAASDHPMPVAFGTFHSVFYNMIRQYKRSAPPVILYDRNKTRISAGVIKKFLGNDITDSISIIQDLTRSISLYKNTLDIEKASDAFSSAKESLQVDADDISKLFRDMFNYYENIRRKSNLMDFDDMVYDCRNLLIHDNRFEDRWAGRFTHILIDEFQDINQVQYETVKLLAGNSSEIFAVGDDDQSIYGFRGSEPSILNKYLEDRKASLLHLNTNFRSDDLIVRASLSVISENKNRIVKKLTSRQGAEEGKISLQGFDSKISEYRAILQIIKTCNYSAAVLFRTNIGMQSFATYLTSQSISYRIREKQKSIFEHFIIKDIYAYMMCVYGKPGEEDLKEIINKPPRFIDHEYLIGSDGDLAAVINRSPEKNKKALNELRKDLAFMKTMSVKSAMTYLYKKIGYEKYILENAGSNDKKAEYKNILNLAMTAFGEADTPEDFEIIKTKYEKSFCRSKTASSEINLNLMTVHASKGLEFNTVIIPDVNEGVFPHGNMQDEETIEEERRIFYVAMTRAAKNLYLFYINGKENKKTIPSRFLTPLLKNNMHKKENCLSR